MRILAIVAALLVTGGVVTVAGSAFADSDSGEGGILSAFSSDEDSDSEDGSEDGSDDGSDDGSEDGSEEEGRSEDEATNEDGEGENGQGEDGGQRRGDEPNGLREDVGEMDADQEPPEVEAAEAEDPLKRDQIGTASADEYVDITDVEANGNRGEGGAFSGGSYTINCGTSDHNNPSNFMVAPGNPNGAQHVHDYVGNTTTDENSDEASLEAGGTSCTNGDRSTFFWPVLRDLNGTDSDANEDGGGRDGNVGRIMTPTSADLTFHGTGDQQVEPLPQHIEIIMGNAKAAVQDGKNANAKYTCSGFTDRVTDQYPICPEGSNLMRLLDYPNCWDGENLSSEDLRSHISFPDENGRCGDDETALPALRITLTYDQPDGRDFAIDTFPDNQHDPTTDHSDFMHFSSVGRAEAGAECINSGTRCTQ